MKKIIIASFLALALGLAILPFTAGAHENYVLTQTEIKSDLAAKGINVFSALNDPANLRVALAVAVCSILGVIIYLFFQVSTKGEKFNAFLNRFDSYGSLILRAAVALSFWASAYFNVFLGPEIPISSIPLSFLIRPALWILGAVVFLGLWSEVAGAAALIILLLATWVYQGYMLSYFNYYGEFIAFIAFGAGVFSLDRLVYKTQKLPEAKHQLEIALIRVTYGISVIYPAVVFKLLHPEVIIDIANRYNLMQFHWLFPHDPLLIALGTGLAQVAVGLCLIIGFETRLNTFITFLLMSLSVIFFKESVWPHIILMALALYLMINNGGKWGLDEYIKNHKEKLKINLAKKFA